MPNYRAIETAVRRFGRTLAEELRQVPPGRSRTDFFRERLSREWNLRAQDARGWTMRARQASKLRAELGALLPWPEAEYEAVLRGGYLPISPDDPLVSVVIPVYGKLDYTVRCLLSLGSRKEKTPFEILVIDDCSPDNTEEALSRCPGIRYVRNATNGGFITSCNRGASAARGKYIHFLNNDTVALPGWLDALVDTFAKIPEAGLVGSKLIYPNLTLQEAGGVVWSDASATNWGNGRDPWNPTFNYLRDADYCSAASVLIPKELFERVGGFEDRYKPAYYEDTDLAFKVRKHGRRVLYQPGSRIVHHEGATSGTDVDVGPKKHQVLNRSKFLATWSDVLSTHGAHGEIGPEEIDRVSGRSVLVIDARTPKPDRDSGSVDSINMLRILRAMGCRVTFISAHYLPSVVPMPDVRGYEDAYTEALQTMGVECLFAPYEPSVDRFLRERGAEFDVVMLSRARVADRFLSAVRRRCPQAKILFNTTDLSYLREEREAEVRQSTWRAWKARDTKKRELGAVAESDATMVLSTFEADLLSKETPGAQVHIVPLIREIPGRNGAFSDRSDVLFLGGFKHRPNLDAVEFLVRDIWPCVREILPGVRLHIVGSATPKEIFAMAADDIVVHGHVADLASLFARVRLTVAPLRFGAGLKGKIAESLGYGVPCVATHVGVEGSGLVDGEDILVADDPRAFAEAVRSAYTDAHRWERLSAQGLEFVRKNYAIDAIQRRLEDVFSALGIRNS